MSGVVDIIKLISNQNLQTSSNIANQVSANYNMAAEGIKVSAGILNSITSSAINFKQTQIDEWYKRENLKQNERELDVRQSQFGAELAYKEKDLKFRQERAREEQDIQRDRLVQSEKNKDAYGFIGQKTRQYTTLKDGYESEAKLYAKELDTINRRLSTDYLSLSDQERDSLMGRANDFQSKYDLSVSKLERINNSYSTLSIAKDSLINGGADADQIMKEVSSFDLVDPDAEFEERAQRYNPAATPQVDVNIQNPESISIGGSAPSNNNIINQAIQDDNRFEQSFLQQQNPNAGKWSQQSTLDRVAKMSVDPRYKDQLGYFVNSAVLPKADQQTVKYFGDQKTNLQKKYFENLFLQYKFGNPDDARRFSLNEDKFNKDYALFGGTPEELDSIRYDAANYAKNIAQVASTNPEGVNDAIRSAIDDRFKTVKPNSENLNSSGLLSASGTLPELQYSSGQSASNLFTDLPNAISSEDAYFRELSNEGRQITNEVFEKAKTRNEEGKTVLSRWAISALNGLSPSELGISDSSINRTVKAGKLMGASNKKSTSEINEQRKRILNDIVSRNDIATAIRLISNTDIKKVER